jgi:phage FluMu gp28-like protein
VSLRDRENAELRWAFARMYVEPRIREASNDESAQGLLPNHEFLIRSTARKQCIVKCRKTAFSWGIALDALARAATEPRSTSIIISYDEDESKAKNRFIDWIYGVLPAKLQDELDISSGSEERRLSNGSFIKFMSKAPTGAGAAIYCDEFSVRPRNGTSPAEILTAAIGATTHTGVIRVGGTQRGPDTLFNKIVTGAWKDELTEGTGLSGEDMAGAEWEIGKFPWWASPALVQLPAQVLEKVGDALKAAQIAYLAKIRPLAENLPTSERVRRFGNARLKEQYISYCKTPELGLEMFQREFEMKVLDESESYFPLDLIRSCIAPATLPPYFFVQDFLKGDEPTEKGKSVVHRVAADLRRSIERNEYAATMDVARDHDLAVIAIGNNTPLDRTLMQVRGLIVMDKVPFPHLRELWYYVLDNLPIVRGAVDTTKGSVGRQLGEEAHIKYGQRSLMFEFTPSNRQIAVAAMKGRMENGGLELPPATRDGLIEREFLSIKRKTTVAGNVIFDAQRTEEGHSDIFMALAMMGTLFDQPETGMPYAYSQSRPEPDIVRAMPGRGRTFEGGRYSSPLPAPRAHHAAQRLRALRRP